MKLATLADSSNGKVQYTMMHVPQLLYRSRCDSQILESPHWQQYSLVKGRKKLLTQGEITLHIKI